VISLAFTDVPVQRFDDPRLCVDTAAPRQDSLRLLENGGVAKW
jgi:hypothetical protein